MPVYRYTIRELQPGGKSSAVIARSARRIGLQKVSAVTRSDIYFVRGIIAPGEFGLLGRFLFCDPVTQEFDVGECPPASTDGVQAIEVAYHPGVTDPVADEIVRSAREFGILGLDAASTAQRYEIVCTGGERLNESELNLLAGKILANPVIQRYAVGHIEPSFPGQTGGDFRVEQIPLHEMDEKALERVNETRRAALDPEEMKAMRTYFAALGRSCTDIEFEMIAQTWSEHCVHKTFKALIDVEGGAGSGLPSRIDNILLSYIKSATDAIAAPWVVSAFKDNAGIIEFDDEYEISFKVETHNHPSAIEPFGGANTGVGGVIRDILGVSARPIAVTDVLCFGPAETQDSASSTKGISAEHIRDGVVAGVQDYGNKMGIPTVNGGIHYHEKYATNPLVYCGCAGIAPKGRHPSSAQRGDRIVVIGGRTGRDGIRGATFSSMTMSGTTFETAGTSVQIGAPIVEKKVAEVVIAARDAGLYSAITDCGAGGLSSAVGEMTSILGGDIELSRAPLKYQGLAPWEIWLSEAQERMVLAVPPEKLDALELLCRNNDVEYCDLGVFTGDGRLVVRYRNTVILDLQCSFLHHGIPQRHLTAAPPALSAPAKARNPDDGLERALEEAGAIALDEVFALVLSHHAVASKEWAIRLYDHEVQGATRVGPFAGTLQEGPSDGAVLKPIETKGSGGIVISNGFNARYGEADSYNAAVSALDEAVRNAVACGADPDRIAVIDNFCWGDPRKPENVWTLLQAARACHDAALAHGTPFISGKDSFNNEFTDENGERTAIPPSLLISAIGLIPDIGCACTTDFKADNSAVYLVGEFAPVFSASVIQDVLAKCPGRMHPGDSIPPTLPGGPGPGHSQKAPRVYRKIFEAIGQSLILACHDLSDGGLGAALSEMCMGGGRGARIDLKTLQKAARTTSELQERESSRRFRNEPEILLLFGETNGCLLAEVPEKRTPEFEKIMSGAPFARIGRTEGTDSICFDRLGGNNAQVKLSLLKQAFFADAEKAFGPTGGEGGER